MWSRRLEQFALPTGVRVSGRILANHGISEVDANTGMFLESFPKKVLFVFRQVSRSLK